MKYTKDNILNLRVRRGGTAEYIITKVWPFDVDIKHIRSGYINPIDVHLALKYLNNGKWTVVGTGKEAVLEEEVYQIY